MGWLDAASSACRIVAPTLAGAFWLRVPLREGIAGGAVRSLSLASWAGVPCASVACENRPFRALNLVLVWHGQHDYARDSRPLWLVAGADSSSLSSWRGQTLAGFHWQLSQGQPGIHMHVLRPCPAAAWCMAGLGVDRFGAAAPFAAAALLCLAALAALAAGAAGPSRPTDKRA